MMNGFFQRAMATCLAILATPGMVAAAAAACPGNDQALGVSRTVEIDTTDGPQYGFQQYKQNDFLKDKEIVLTFDDGPVGSHTPTVLEALKEHCTKATFFMVGRMAMNSPALVRQVAAEGHTIGTHTWSHRSLSNLSKKRGVRQIERGISAVTKALGRPVAPFFRFPYLADPDRMIEYLKERQIGIFSIDVDSSDYRTRSPGPVVRKVLRDLKSFGKGIVLFHDIQRSTARALPSLLRKLKEQGYKVVHLVPKQKVITKAAFDKETDQLFQEFKTASAGGQINTSARRSTRRARSKTRRRSKSKKSPATDPASTPKADWQDEFLGGG